MLRILMVIGRYRPKIGGTEIQAELLAQSLAQKGVAVEILTGRQRGLERDEHHHGIHIQRLWIPDVGIPIFNAIALTTGLYGTIIKRRDRFDILHAHQGFYPAFAGVAAATHLGKTSIIKISNSGELLDLQLLSCQARPIGPLAAKFLQKHTGIFVALNEQIASALTSRGIPEQRITHIPNGVVIPSPLASEERLIYRRRLNLPLDHPLLICVGSLKPVKKQSLLIAALRRLAKQGRIVTLLLLGDGPLRLNLERQAEKSNLSERVIFGGCVTNVLDYLYAADLFILPSSVEGLSNALLEAMSIGLPCIASNIPGNRVLIQSGVNGLLFESGNIDKLIESILELLLDRKKAISLGIHARETIETNYSIENITNQYIAIYHKLLRS